MNACVKAISATATFPTVLAKVVAAYAAQTLTESRTHTQLRIKRETCAAVVEHVAFVHSQCIETKLAQLDAVGEWITLSTALHFGVRIPSIWQWKNFPSVRILPCSVESASLDGVQYSRVFELALVDVNKFDPRQEEFIVEAKACLDALIQEVYPRATCTWMTAQMPVRRLVGVHYKSMTF
jgi:hypothetical protein